MPLISVASQWILHDVVLEGSSKLKFYGTGHNRIQCFERAVKQKSDFVSFYTAFTSREL